MSESSPQESYDGLDLIDTNAEPVGSIKQTYDDANGQAQLVSVDIGVVATKCRLVPVWSARQTSRAVQVPYDKDMIAGSPDASDVGDSISRALLREVTEYYGVPAQASGVQGAEMGARPATEQQPDAMPADAQSAEIRDLGDVIEIPIVEERLVKQPVVTEVLRVRKTAINDTFTAGADVRKEEIERQDVKPGTTD